jgi:hypothetical protein
MADIFFLDNIIQNDKTTIKYLSESIKKRGYTFVRLPYSLVKLIDECTIIMENFFLQETEYKNFFSKKPIFGYSKVNHKENFRFLTLDRLNEHNLPTNFTKIKHLISIIDKLMYRIVLLTSPYLFPKLIEITNTKKIFDANKLSKYDIPLFDKEKKWSMFDVSKYYNDGKRDNLNCEEHYDPGLLSIHLRSTAKGLQLKNEYNEWINPPNDKNIAIIWTGGIAKKINPNINTGIHRVKNTNSPRIAMWYEICISSQEHKELDSDIKINSAFNNEEKTGIPISKSLPQIKEKSSDIVLYSSDICSLENIKKYSVKDKKYDSKSKYIRTNSKPYYFDFKDYTNKLFDESSNIIDENNVNDKKYSSTYSYMSNRIH